MSEKSLKRKGFYYTVQTPFVSLLVVLTTVCAVALLVNISSIDRVYTDMGGEVSYNQGEIVVQFNAHKSVADELSIGQKIGWDTERGKSRYNAVIMKKTAGSDELVYVLAIELKGEKGLPADARNSVGHEKVYVRALAGKEKVLDKFMESKQEDTW